MSDDVLVFVADEQGRWLAKVRMAHVPREGERIAFMSPGRAKPRSYHVANVLWTFDEPTSQGGSKLIHVTVTARTLDDGEGPYR